MPVLRRSDSLSFNIAVAGKGGTGKTSITTLVIRHLLKAGLTPVLAVDADPNANLADGLGLKVGQTIGSIIAAFDGEKINIPAGMTKEAYLELKLNDAVLETKGLDLLTMGRGEGAGCYCYPNVLLRKFIDTLAKNYAYMVMDNEAGMEHLSRRTTQDIDALLLVSDHSIKGVRTIARLKALVVELKLNVRKEMAVLNLVPGQVDPVIAGELDRLGITPAAALPYDENICQFDILEKPLIDLPDNSPAVKAVRNLMTLII